MRDRRRNLEQTMRVIRNYDLFVAGDRIFVRVSAQARCLQTSASVPLEPDGAVLTARRDARKKGA